MGGFFLGFLKCEKCGGYYELKEGEAIDDFEGCSCGGKFKYVKSIDGLESVKDLDSHSEDKSICPNCGTENLKNVKFCGSCGKPIKKPISPDPDKNKKISEKPLYCPNCGTENIRTAKTCRNCNKSLNILPENSKPKVSNSNKSTKYPNKRKYGILGTGIIGIALIAFLILWLPTNVFASHYDDGVISFNYPTTMNSSSAPEDLIAGGSNWVTLQFLTNNAGIPNNKTVYILITKNPTIADPNTVRDATNNEILQYSGQVISTTDKTNSNGVAVSKNIFTIITEYTNPNTNTTSNMTMLYYDMNFKGNNGAVYGISVYGENSTNSPIANTADMVFNSIKTSK